MLSVEITHEHFPTPHLALRAGVDEARVRAFAHEQAVAATAIHQRLHTAWADPWTGVRERVQLLGLAYDEAADWRYRLALRGATRLGVGVAGDAERFRTPISDAGPNYDRIGDIGRFRTGSTWDPTVGAYVGGAHTPASRIAAAYGHAARARFALCAPDTDVLDTLVTLPDSRQIHGNRLVRGDTARALAEDLAARITARGGDPARLDVGIDPIYVATADDHARQVMFDEAMGLLATAQHGDIDAWRQATYLLYQAPRYKKGSDATTRVFLVAVGAALLGEPPVLPQDIDLRCMVLGQAMATAAYQEVSRG